MKFGLAVDYIHKKLYITTFSLRAKIGGGTIDVCEFDGSRRATIATGLNQPTKLVLQPSNGFVFLLLTALSDMKIIRNPILIFLQMKIVLPLS